MRFKLIIDGDEKNPINGEMHLTTAGAQFFGDDNSIRKLAGVSKIAIHAHLIEVVGFAINGRLGNTYKQHEWRLFNIE